MKIENFKLIKKSWKNIQISNPEYLIKKYSSSNTNIPIIDLDKCIKSEYGYRDIDYTKAIGFVDSIDYLQGNDFYGTICIDKKYKDYKMCNYKVFLNLKKRNNTKKYADITKIEYIVVNI